jgi:hypothetical protein
LNAVHFPTFGDACADNSTNSGVHTGRVTTACENGNIFHSGFLFAISLMDILDKWEYVTMFC